MSGDGPNRDRLNQDRPTLAATTWQHLTEIGRPRRYPRGATLMAEGDPGGVVYALVSGTVDIELAGGRKIATVTPGQLVGELSAIDGLPRSASVVAATDVDVRALPAPLLLEALQQFEPAALGRFIAAVNRMRAVTEVAAIRAGGAPVRHVASWLVERLPDPAAEPAPGRSTAHQPTSASQTLFVDLDPGEVATELGISSELLSRALGHLATAGSVVLDHGRVLILDASILERLSNNE